MATHAKRTPGAGGSARSFQSVKDIHARPVETRQLELDLGRPQQLVKRRRTASATATLGLRLALSPDEAAALLGVSRDYFDEHILCELRSVRRGRRVLIAVRELERWLESAGTRRSA